MTNGVGDSCHRRHNGHFAHASHAIGVPRIGDLYDHRVNHGQVQGGGHPVIQEAGVEHLPLIAHEVLFIQGPSDALNYATLHLSFDIAGMDGFTRILDYGVAQDGHLAGLRVYLHIGDLGAECAARAPRVNADLAGYGAAGAVQLRRQLLEGHLQVRVRLVLENAVNQVDVLGGNVPDGGGPLNHFALDVLGAFIGGPTAGEGDPAAAGKES